MKIETITRNGRTYVTVTRFWYPVTLEITTRTALLRDGVTNCKPNSASRRAFHKINQLLKTLGGS